MLVAGIGVVVGTCRLNDLISPPKAAILKVIPVKPEQLRDSSAYGSTAPRRDSISIVNEGGGELRWRASVKHADTNPWVTLDPDTGTVSESPPLWVVFDPSGLDSGSYRDTVVVEAVSGSGSLEVPLLYYVHSCRTTPISVGDSVADSLTTADCGAPHRGGRFAKLYRFSGIANDSVTIDVSAGFDSYVALDTSLAGNRPPLIDTNDCLGLAGDPCLYYIRLPLPATYYVEVTSADSGATGPFTLRLLRKRPPSLPDSLDQRLATDSTTPVDPGATVSQSSVVLRALVSDPDLGDTLHLEAEVRPSGTNFSSPTAVGSGFPNESPAYVLVTGLVDNTNYHWRLRAVDQTGTSSGWVTFGADPAFDVRTGHDPDAPTTLQQLQENGTPIPVGDVAVSTTVRFSGVVTDPDPGDVLHLQVEVQPVGTSFTGTPSPQSFTTASSGGTSTVTVTAPILSDGQNYHWQARTVDNSGRAGPWVSFGNNLESDVDFHVTVVSNFNLVFTVQPSQATAGEAIAPAVTVRAQDQFGQTITSFTGTVTMSIATGPPGGAFSPLAKTTATAASGVATFDSLIINKAGSYTIQASALVSGNTIFSPQSSSFDVVAAAATGLAFTVQPPPSTTAGVVMAPAIQVSAQDQYGNTNQTFTSPVAMSIAANPGNPAGTLRGTKTVSAANGVAVFSTLSIDRTGAGYTLRAAASGLAPDTSTGFSITPAPATHLAFEVQPSTAEANQVIMPAIKVAAHDSLENVATGFTGNVTLQITSGTGTSGAVLTGGGPLAAASGTATFPNVSIDKNGTGYTLTATAATGGLPPAVSNPFDITNSGISAANSSVEVSSNTITASNGSSQTTITVTARDLANNTVGGASVTLSVTPGTGNTLTGNDPQVTNSSGVATWTLSSTKAETKTASAIINSVSITQQQTVTVNPGPLAAWAFQSLLRDTTAGAAINASSGGVVVTGSDQFGNRATSFNGTVTMTLGANPAGGTLSGTTTETAGAGMATFGNLLITKAGNGYRLQASGGSVNSPLSNSFAISPAAANKLVFTTQPQTTAVLAKIDSAIGGVVVTVQDAYGNTTPFGGTVRINIGVDAAGGTTLTGGGAISAPSGVAVFPNLTLNKLGTGFTLLASTTTGGVGGDESAPFDIVPGPAAKLAITTPPPSTAQNGVPLSQQPVIQVQDANGFNVSESGKPITVAIGSGPGGSLSNASATTDASGRATFSGLTITGPVGTYTLRFDAPGLTSVNSASISLSAGSVSASQSTVSASPTSITASNGSNASTITVTAKDQSGNPIGGTTVVLAASGTGNTLTQPASTTNSSGVATGTLSSTTAEAKTVSATINGVPITQTATVTVTAGAVSASQSTISASPATITASNGTSQSTITVAARDQFGNPIQGATVVLAATGGGNTLTQPSGPTNATGIATGTLSSTAKGDKTVSATINGTAITQTATVTVTTGTVSVSQSTVSATPTSITASSGTSQSTITVTAKDQFGNPVQGATVVLAATGGGNTLTQPSGPTNASGIATGTLSSTVTGDKVVSATVNGATINQTVTVTVTPDGVSPSQSTVSASPTTISASNGSSQSTITVTAKDQFGNPIQGAIVVLAATGAGNTLTQASGPTDATGVATGMLSSTATGDKVVSATANGTAITQTATVTVTAGTVSASNSTVSASPTTITASSGSSTSTINVTARDGTNNTIAGASVTLAISGSGNTTSPVSLTATTNGSGVATWTLSSTVAETKIISATINTVSITQTATVSVNPAAVSAGQSTVTAAPTTITSCSSGCSTGAGTASLITVTASDQFGNVIPAATVVLAANPTTGNNLTQPSGTTNSSGVATGTLSSSTAETKTVSATINGTAIAQTATVTVTAGTVSATNSTVSASPATIPASTGSSTSTITVTARDGANNVIAGATVTLAISGTGNSTTPASLTATTNGSGQAIWSLSSTVAETKTISATINATAINQSASVTVTAASAQSIAYATQPTNSTAGAVISAPAGVQVEIRDQFGNRVASATKTVSIAIDFNAGGGTLSGTTSVTPTGGVATFNDLSINKVGTGYTLRANYPALAAVTSSAFDIVASTTPSTSLSTVGASPTTITASTGSSSSIITVTANDQFGNPIQGATVVLAATGTGNTLTQPGGTTNASGVATGTLSSTAAGDKVVSATINGTAITQTATVTVSASNTASASLSTVSAAPTSITASTGSSSSTITVTANDQFGNPIQGATVVLAATGTGNTLTQPGGTTNASGVATGTLSSTAAGDKVVSATINGTAITQTATVTVSASNTASASLSTVSAAPTSITASTGSSSSTITVTANDQFGNPIQGATVVLAATGTGNTLTQPGGTTNASGVATGTLSSTAAGDKVVSATINGTPITQTATVTVNADAISAGQSTVGASPTTITAGASSTITVTVKDQFGNPIQGVTVVLSSASGDVTFTQPGTTTDASGVTTGTMDTTGSTAPGNKVVTATANAVSITQTATVTVN